jgi:hypothetical protein
VPVARDYIEQVKTLLAETNAEDTFVFRADLLALEGFVNSTKAIARAGSVCSKKDTMSTRPICRSPGISPRPI